MVNRARIIKLIDPEQMQDVFFLRNEVLVKEKRLIPENKIYLPQDHAASHFLVLVENNPVGCVSVYIDYEGRALPAEEHAGLSKYKTKLNAEIYHLVLLPQYRNQELFPLLQRNTLNYLKHQNVQRVFISLKREATAPLRFLQKNDFTLIQALAGKGQEQVLLMRDLVPQSKLKLAVQYKAIN